MGMDALTEYFIRYGAVVIFVVVLLEYMNLPGFPAGIIMPVAGIWAAQGEVSFFMVMLLSVAAGLLGSWILYFIGLLGGWPLLERWLARHPKYRKNADKAVDFVRRRGSYGVFIAKLLPVVRTLISLPAGVLKMSFIKYTISSALGVFVWNLALIGAGYYLGEAVFQLFE